MNGAEGKWKTTENSIVNQKAVRQKIARLRAGGKLRLLDLFSGCGGLSLGFQAAGCEVTAAVESDPDAAKSHGTNFHGGTSSHTLARDITKTPLEKLVKELKLGHPESAFDVIVGGPPCQAFTRVGRSKLREVAAHPEAFRHDPRARLYIDYINYVKDAAPLIVVLENVPDMLNFGGHNIAHEVCDVLTAFGYTCGYTLLNAARYGVPQMRERAFVVAIRRELSQSIEFPKPSHHVNLPSGYEGSRAVALKLLTKSDTHGPDAFWKTIPEALGELPNAVTAKEAIGDLPFIDAIGELKAGRLKRGARRFDKPVSYPDVDNISEFARSMRTWPGFVKPESLVDHVIRYLPRDYKLFTRLSPGDQYPEAYSLAESMFKEELKRRCQSGEEIVEGSTVWKDIRASIVPPYDYTKFPNKWRKMEANKPARTLMAHLGKDSYSHIHYDSAQGRTISVREAARLQSFPDGFVFCGTMNPAFRQIGNAVPPLLAKAIAEKIISQIEAISVPELRRAAVNR